MRTVVAWARSGHHARYQPWESEAATAPAWLRWTCTARTSRPTRPSSTTNESPAESLEVEANAWIWSGPTGAASPPSSLAVP
jgi:hypothetical protein